MALAMMDGLIVATILTLTFLPALYAFAFRVQTPHSKGQSIDKLPAEVTEPELQAAA
jgi:Cu/Ag efflux pump CusA